MKKLLFLLLCLVFSMTLLLTSCNFGNTSAGNEDEDSENDDKNKDDDDDDDDDKDDGNDEGTNQITDCSKGHTGAIICENCLEPLFTADIPVLPAFDTLGMKLTNFTVNLDDDASLNSEGNDFIAKVGELFVRLDENGKLYGYGTAKVEFDPKDNGVKAELDALVLVEDATVYFSLDGIGLIEDTDQEPSAIFCVSADKIAEMVVAETQLSEMEEAINEISPTIEEWLTDSLIPIIEKIDLEDVYKEAGRNYAKLINACFKVSKKTNGSTVLTFNVNKLKEFNHALYEDSVAEVIDLVYGDGTFSKIKKLFKDNKLYNFSVADALSHLNDDMGIDLIKLLDSLDELAVAITGDEDATLENSLLPMLAPDSWDPNTEIDFSDLLIDEEFLDFQIKHALQILFDTKSPSEAVKLFKEGMAEELSKLEKTTFYELLGATSEDDSVEYVDDCLDQFASLFTLSLTADTASKIITNASFETSFDTDVYECDLEITLVNGKFTVSVEIDEFGDDVIDFAVSTTNDKLALDCQLYSYDTEADISLELIPGYTVAVDEEQIANIKAQITKATSKITIENVYTALATEKEGLCAVFLDETSGTIYQVEINSYDSSYFSPSWGDLVSTYTIVEYVTVTYFKADDYYVHGVSTLGKDCAIFTLHTASYFDTRLDYTSDVDITSIEDAIALINLADIKNAAAYADIYSDDASVQMFYDMESDEIIFDRSEH